MLRRRLARDERQPEQRVHVALRAEKRLDLRRKEHEQDQNSPPEPEAQQSKDDERSQHHAFTQPGFQVSGKMMPTSAQTPPCAQPRLVSDRAARLVRLIALLSAPALFAAGCGGGGGGDSGSVPGPNPDLVAYANPGPLHTTVDAVADCTIFRPASLGAEGQRTPVILWGNGSQSVPTTYAVLLGHLASHGFIVAAANTSNAGDGSQMLECLDSLHALDVAPGSAFFGRVGTGRVGAAGHSQGGAGALMAGRDPRVKATAPIAPYVLPIAGGGNFESPSIGQQQGPMLLLSGAGDTVSSPETHQRAVFNGANKPVVWATLLTAGHTIVSGAGLGFHAPVTAWFRATLADDARAAGLFPPACALCSSPEWSVVHR